MKERREREGCGRMDKGTYMGGRRRLSRRRREGGLDERHKNWVNERMECAEGVERKW